MLSRIAHASRLQSLTLHGTFEQPAAAAIVFGSDHVIEGRHTFLPHLEAFRFVLVGHDDEFALWRAVTGFLRGRKGLRRLDLGGCPWESVFGLLLKERKLEGLRVLRVRIPGLNGQTVQALVESLPQEMVAVHLSTAVWEKPLVIRSHSSRVCSCKLADGEGRV